MLHLLAASSQFDASLRVARKQALDANGIAALQTALAVLQAAWQRVVEKSLDHQHLLPSTYQSQWAENNQLVSHASAGFNRAVLAYNAAIAQFPALLMARLFAFRPAGCL